MRACQKAFLVLAFSLLAFGAASMAAVPAEAGRAARPTRGRGARVAVQPFDGQKTEPLRSAVVRVVRGRGFRTMTSLPRYEGTGQYPVLAKDHNLTAFVTADVEERGKWQRITFLVWDGNSGSVLGRWTASGPATSLSRTVGRGFWSRLGPAMLKASAPRSPNRMDQAAPMRIDASDPMDDPLATR